VLSPPTLLFDVACQVYVLVMLLFKVMLQVSPEHRLEAAELVIEGSGFTVIETVCVEPGQPFEVGMTE
jgi:hypothetical protein